MSARIQAYVLIAVVSCTVAYIAWYSDASSIEARYDLLDSVQQFKKQYPEYDVTVESGLLHMVSISYAMDLGEKTTSLKIADFNGPLVFYSCELKMQNNGRYSIFQVFSPDAQIISDYPCENTHKERGQFTNTPPYSVTVDPPLRIPVNLSLLAPLFVLATSAVFSIRLYAKQRR